MRRAVCDRNRCGTLDMSTGTKKATCILLIGDGMGGRPVPELGGKTTIEAAMTPSLDRLACDGMCGLMAPIALGIRAGSDTSHLALLGYDPHTCYTGRGPFECAGIGMDVSHGDIAFRCNFSTIDARGVVRDRRAGRITKGTKELARALRARRPRSWPGDPIRRRRRGAGSECGPAAGR